MAGPAASAGSKSRWRGGVEGVDLLGGAVLVGDGAVSDAGTHHGHGQVVVTEAAMASGLIPRLMALMASVCRNWCVWTCPTPAAAAAFGTALPTRVGGIARPRPVRRSLAH
jgi:hypothetical protein